MARTIVDAQRERAHKGSICKDLMDKSALEGRILNAEEQQIFDTATENIAALETEIAGLQAHAERQEKAAVIWKSLNDPQGRKTAPDEPAKSKPEERIPAQVRARSGKLKAFAGANGEERAYRSGQWLRAMVFGDTLAEQWCHNHGMNLRNALSTGDNSKGGYLVPEEFSQAVIDLREAYGIFRRECRTVPMGSDTLVIPRRRSGASVAFIGENALMSESTNPTWSQVRLTAKKLGALALVPSELAEDSVIDLAEWLAEEFAYEFALKEDQCGFNGDGTQTYGGMTGVRTAILTLAGAVDAATNHDTFAEIDAGDLTRVMAALPEYARPNAKWYCSAVCDDLVFGRLKAAAGGNDIQAIEGGYQRRYLGYPIVVSQVLPTVQTDLSDVAMLLFGDLSKAATLGNRRGISTVMSSERYLEYDQIAVRAIERFDINVHDVGDATTAGPIVALIGD